MIPTPTLETQKHARNMKTTVATQQKTGTSNTELSLRKPTEAALLSLRLVNRFLKFHFFNNYFRKKLMHHPARISCLVELEEARLLFTLLVENGAIMIDAMIKERLILSSNIR